MLKKILSIDYKIFYIINKKFSNSIFDFIFPFLRSPSLWIPLYIFLLVYVLKNFKKLTSVCWMLYFVSTVSIADIMSSQVVKKLVYRQRPCLNPIWQGIMHHLTNYCSYASSFTSSHACNHFAMAFFFYYTLKQEFGIYVYLFFLWAFLISYAQVYVGVHYPLDILCGGILGSIIGMIMAKFLRQKIVQHN